jgi:hypothetical protein
VGDHFRRNSEAGHVSGRIIKMHTRDTEQPRHVSPEDPRYEIQSDKTEHIAMHEGEVLDKIY